MSMTARIVLLNVCRCHARLAKGEHGWLVGGILLLSLRNTHCLSTHGCVKAEASCLDANIIPTKTLLRQRQNQSVESRMWKNIKKIARMSVDFARILRRAFYWLICFSPSIATSPLLLLNSPKLSEWWWDLAKRGIWAAGPCLTKFSQWAATRPDIFPTNLCDCLAQLQSDTEPHDWSETDRVLVRAFGPSWRKKLTLDKRASVGSGLVAQVYHGSLVMSKQSNELIDVAIKVLHPNVKRALEDDLALMRIVAGWLESIVFWGEGLLGLEPEREGGITAVFSLSENVEEFSDLMTAQLDLQREGQALARFHNNFSSPYWSDRVIFPTPVAIGRSCDEKSSNGANNNIYGSPDVLVETYQCGIPMTEILARKEEGSLSKRVNCNAGESFSWTPLTVQEEKQVAALGMDIVLKMIFEDNFIHGDLHPGNMLLVRSDGTNDQSPPFQLVLLDAGIYAELDRKDRQNFLSLFKAVLADDGASAARMMIEKSREFELPNGTKMKLQPVRQEEFEKKMQALVHSARVNGLRLGGDCEIGGVSGLLRDVLTLCYEHQVRLESRFVSVILGVAIIEGLGRRLDPDIDILARAAPFIARAATRAILS